MSKIYWLYLFLLLLPATIWAEDVRYFDIEIILYENLDTSTRSSEFWPSSVELKQEDEMVVLGKPFTGTLPKEYDRSLTFKLLPAKSLQLTEQATKIDKSESRRVLLHTAWRQPGMASDNAMTVYFKQDVPGTPVSIEELGGGASDTTSAPSVPFITPEAGELEGMIKVVLSRYLHVSADIVFRPTFEDGPKDVFSIEELEGEVLQPVVYRHNQTRRRIRSRELHYLDDPVLGLLILITPYEAET